MSNLIYSMMLSLDGFIARPNGDLDWIIIDDELHTFANEQARETSAFLYGRRMYELMASHWPTAETNPSAPAVEVEFARIWKNKPKIVFSKTLASVAWNSRLVRDNVADEVRTLKAQPGKDLSVGGATLAAELVQLGLIDEYYLFIQPVILGNGIPCFPVLNTMISLRLVETRSFNSGVMYLRYRRDDDHARLTHIDGLDS